MTARLGISWGCINKIIWSKYGHDINTCCTITFWERQHTCTFHKILQKQTKFFGVKPGIHDTSFASKSPFKKT